VLLLIACGSDNHSLLHSFTPSLPLSTRTHTCSLTRTTMNDAFERLLQAELSISQRIDELSVESRSLHNVIVLYTSLKAELRSLHHLINDTKQLAYEQDSKSEEQALLTKLEWHTNEYKVYVSIYLSIYLSIGCVRVEVAAPTRAPRTGCRIACVRRISKPMPMSQSSSSSIVRPSSALDPWRCNAMSCARPRPSPRASSVRYRDSLPRSNVVVLHSAL